MEFVGGFVAIILLHTDFKAVYLLVCEVEANAEIRCSEVAHNYERNHVLNMWFVIATDQTERLPSARPINSIII